MKVAIYARVSTEKQEQEHTIQSQIEELERYAKTNGHTVFDRHIDEGWSGSVLARPGLDKLRDDASKKLFAAVLIHSPDRLARNYVHQEILIEELKRRGLEVVFLNRPLADTPEDKMLQGMQGLFAEYEKTKIAERFRRGKMHKARSNLIVGHMAPFGYRYVKRQGEKREHYVVNEQEAATVRLIFREFVKQQLTLGGLVKLLYIKGIKPRKMKMGWQRSSLNRILRNETYVGTTYYNKSYGIEPTRAVPSIKYRRVQKSSRRYRPKEEWMPIQVAPIITRDLFERAQEQLNRNAQFSPRKTKYQYLLRGLTRCGLCGALYAGIPCHGKRQYRCRNKDLRFPLPKNCKARMISAHIVEPLVWSSVCETLSNPRVILDQFRKFQRDAEEEGKEAEADKMSRQRSLESMAGEENRLLEAYRQEVITLVQLREHLKQVGARRQQLDLEAAPPKLLPLQNAKGWLRAYAAFVRKRMARLTFEERQQFLRSLVTEILIFHDQIKIRGAIPTEEPPRDTVCLRPNNTYGMDAKKHLQFEILKELRHGKALPIKNRGIVNQ